MERLSTKNMPLPLPQNRLMLHQLGDLNYYMLFTTAFAMTDELELQRAELDTKLVQVFEVYARSVQVGWCFKAAGRKVILDDHSLMVPSANFSSYTLKDVLNSGHNFMLKYHMPDWQYLTYNGMCSVIIVPPDPATVERLD